MLISPEIWQNRSRLNNPNHLKTLKCLVKIRSKYLTIQDIKPHHLERIEEVIRLRELGFQNKEIAEIFNQRGWRKWNGSPLYNRLDIGNMVLQWNKKQKTQHLPD